MKKIEAINELMSGNCDGIVKGSSKYILLDDSIVNARSKKPLDMKALHEDEWDTYNEPKWYDHLDETDGILCWISGEDLSIVKKMSDKGEFFNVFDELLGTEENVVPAVLTDVQKYIIGHKPAKKRKTREEKVAEVVEEAVTVSEGIGSQGLSQSENSENTVSQKEDVGNESSSDDNEEIPF